MTHLMLSRCNIFKFNSVSKSLIWSEQVHEAWKIKLESKLERYSQILINNSLIFHGYNINDAVKANSISICRFWVLGQAKSCKFPSEMFGATSTRQSGIRECDPTNIAIPSGPNLELQKFWRLSCQILNFGESLKWNRLVVQHEVRINYVIW